MKILIHMNEKFLQPKGGAGAVCYYYNEEQKKRGDDLLYFLPNLPGTTQKSNFFKTILIKFVNYLEVLRKLYFGPKSTGRNYDNYDIVHFHDTNSLYYALADLKEYRGKILLQSHSPQPLAEELYDSMNKKLRLLFPFAKYMYKRMDKMAFERADYIIFPCPEAEEPYKKSLSYFNKIHQNRPNAFKYLLTGIPASIARRSRQEVCNELNIPQSDFIITYVGRHNEIKGFDLLKLLADKLFSQYTNMWVISAGKEDPIKRLEHNNWKEIGWTTDAHSYISAADVFILPNRETYFDIVMLEVLSLGKIVVASRTGGNRFFENNNLKGVFLYDSIDDAVDIIKKIYSMSINERKLLGLDNYNYYNKNLTVSSMYDNYFQIINEL